MAEDFATLLDEMLGANTGFAGSVVTGKVIRIDDDVAVVDVGLKSEGRVPLKEFAAQGMKPEVQPGDVVDLFVERYEDRDGTIVLSREKARREEAWTTLEKAFAANQRVDGILFGRVKGGFTVDLGGAVAFLPGSQVDIRPVRDVGPLMGQKQPFQILKMDRARGNIVVSRRACLRKPRRAAGRAGAGPQGRHGAGRRGEEHHRLRRLRGPGRRGRPAHVTDIAWRRINHPSEALTIGMPVKVQVIRFNSDTQRISLGMKQLMSDPWDGVAVKYPVNARFSGRVTNITDYGAFVELEPGVEGLVHVSEMSWTKKNVHPGKIVATSEQVDVMILDVDEPKRRISLGLKQAQGNPWEVFLQNHPLGSTIEGEIRNITEFGLFVGVGPDVDGMVHLSDLSWDEPGETAIAKYTKGDMVKAKVLDVDFEKERISLGIKQLEADPAAEVLDKVKKGDIVNCTVTKVEANGIEVKVTRCCPASSAVPSWRATARTSGPRSTRSVTWWKPRSPPWIARPPPLPDHQGQGDRGGARGGEGIRHRDSGASLGDILGAAIRRRREMAARNKTPRQPLSRTHLKADPSGPAFSVSWLTCCARLKPDK
jgi:small subunit ribosomal protein S1